MTFKTLPDPADRSKNEPLLLLQPKDVLSIYNNLTSRSDLMLLLNETIRTKITSEALALGWRNATFLGNQCLLSMEET